MSSNLRSVGRTGVSFTLELWHGGPQSTSCRARNISLEGMLLQTDEVSLTVGSRVELHISVDQQTWKVAAVVLHNYGHTMGVMFRQPQPDLYRAVTRRTSI